MDRIEVVVEDDVLLQSDIDRLVAVRYLPPAPGESDASYRERTREARIVDLLRERELLRTGAPEPEARALEGRLAELEARAASEGTTLASRLALARMTRDELIALLKRGLALEAFVRDRIGASVRVTDGDIEALYASASFREEARRRGIALVPFAALPGDVKDQLRVLATERKLTEAVERWTAELRKRARVVVYRPGSGVGAPSPAAESR